MKFTIQLTLACLMPILVMASTGLSARSVATTVDEIYPQIPACSIGCFNQTIWSDGCDINDLACHCTKTDIFHDAYLACILPYCDATDAHTYVMTLVYACNALESRSEKAIPYGGIVPRASPSALPSALNFAEYGYPNCSVKCITDALPFDGCDSIACHCNQTENIEKVFNDCITKSCGPSCQQQFQTSLQKSCSEVGVTVAEIPQTPVNQFEPAGSPNCPAPNAYPPIPECSQRCFNQTISTDGCCLADSACHCSKTAAFQASFENCIVHDCPKRSQQKAYVKALTDACQSVCVNPTATLSLPASASGGYHARVRRDAIPASGDGGAIVSSILAGLGPIVSNTTKISATATRVTSLTVANQTYISGSALTTTQTQTTTGSDVSSTSTATMTATSVIAPSNVTAIPSSGSAVAGSSAAGIFASVMLAMVGLTMLMI